MSDYDITKLRRLDLTVLLIFLGLMRTRKAVAVAAELRLTSSSISHALRRLRDVFGDELFLRRPHGLEPTAFAERIEPDVRRAVDGIQAALAGPARFDPATAEGLVRIAASDREAASLIPAVFRRIAAEAPGLRFSVRTLPQAESLRGLGDGTLDLAIGYFRAPGTDHEVTPLRSETYAVVARAGHSLFEAELTPESYAAASHVLVSGDGSLSGIADWALARLGLTRRVCLAVPAFLPALAIVADSDFISTLPSTVVDQNARRYGLEQRPPPVAIRPLRISLVRHRRNVRDPMLSWCLERFLPGKG